MTFRPWMHKASVSAVLTAVVVGAMTAEGIVLREPGRAPGLPPGAARPPAGTPQPSHEPRSARPRAAVSVTPQPGDGARLVAEQAPSPQPRSARSSAQPEPSPSSDPVPQPSASATTAAPGISPLCVVNALGIKVCIGGGNAGQ